MLLKKSLGQHFLNNTHIIAKIIDAADPTPDTLVLEIGPGDGALTRQLLGLDNKIIAIETDARMIEVLNEEFSGLIEAGMFDIVQANILEWDETVMATYDVPYAIVANIPYYITGAIIRKFLTSSVQPESMTLIMQREVADRIMARDGKESLLSIGVKAYGVPTSHGIIKRGNFTPPPKVDSAILRITDISRDFFLDIDEGWFWELVHAGFAHKRKQLATNLRGLVDSDKLAKVLEQLGLSQTVRAEDVGLEEWRELVQLTR